MKRLFFIITIVIGISSLNSCYQIPEKGTAKITIFNSLDFREPAANVHLYGPTGSYIDVWGVTDLNGEYIYEHDKNLSVVLNVHAENATGTSWCDGIIRIEPDADENESYTLYP